jgi:hypothetical protein
MTDERESTDVDRFFAATLGGLEDHATRLVEQQRALLGQLADVERDLQRIERARAAMVQQPPRSRGPTAKTARRQTRRPSTKAGRSERAEERKARALDYVREQRRAVDAHEVAGVLGLDPQGAGGLLSNLARKGQLVQEGTRHDRRWTLASDSPDGGGE